MSTRRSGAGGRKRTWPRALPAAPAAVMTDQPDAAHTAYPEATTPDRMPSRDQVEPTRDRPKNPGSARPDPRMNSFPRATTSGSATEVDASVRPVAEEV